MSIRSNANKFGACATLVALAISALASVRAYAQATGATLSGTVTDPYGAPITLGNAKKAASRALAEARKNNWIMTVAIVDSGGNLVYYEKMDNSPSASANVAIDKARSANLFKRPTKDFQDAVAAGGAGLRLLDLEGAVPLAGGIPLVVNGKIVGAIGVSGGIRDQDAQCAKAGVDALKNDQADEPPPPVTQSGFK